MQEHPLSYHITGSLVSPTHFLLLFFSDDKEVTFPPDPVLSTADKVLPHLLLRLLLLVLSFPVLLRLHLQSRSPLEGSLPKVLVCLSQDRGLRTSLDCQDLLPLRH